jgi:hypothetical protein
MASVVSAAVAKFNALTAANFPSSARPPIYLDEAPLKDSAGADERPGYAVLTDEGLTTEQVFDYPVVETGSFLITVYYRSLADCDAAAEAVKYNGGTLANAGGFDNGTLTLPSGYTLLALRRTSERRRYAGLDYQGARVHAVEIRYSHEVQRI